jgi:hypothetical protein
VWNESREESHALSLEKWENPDRGPSKDFAAISYIHTLTTTLGAQSVSRRFLYGCGITNGYHTNTLRMSYFYTKVCGNTNRLLDVRVCFSSTTLTSGLDIIFMLSTNESTKSAIRQLNAKWCNILGSVPTGLFEVMPPVVMQTLWLHHSGAPTHRGEDYLPWPITICPGRWIGRGGQSERPVISRI